MPDFSHSFEPKAKSSLGPVISLETREIADAGLFEVLQTPGAAIGNWDLLDHLLDSDHKKFVFKNPLGLSREVKTAISGLFGRFVARAYATRYLSYRHYLHVTKSLKTISNPIRAEIRRVRGARGDLPDWLALGPTGIAIIEAKGCHDGKGPYATLQRAYTQACRLEVMAPKRSQVRTLPFKRYAIATRWGFSSPTYSEPMIAVKDPDIKGDEFTEDEISAVKLNIIRLHFSSILHRLGHIQLATSIAELATTRFTNRRESAKINAQRSLDNGIFSDVDSSARTNPSSPLLGAFVARGGIIISERLSELDQETLRRLDLQPCYVGIEKSTLLAAIEGDLKNLSNDQLYSKLSEPPDTSVGPTTDNAGSWIVRLGSDSVTLK